MLEYKLIRSFLVLGQELHFGRAAIRLNMTQSPLSRQMQQLEDELGVQLFSRTSRVVQLTPAGRTLLIEAQKLLQQREAAIQTVRQAAQINGGLVSIGMFGAAAYSFLPRLMLKARSELPNVIIQFKEMSSSQQLEALALNKIDIGLVRPFVNEHENYITACVMREKLVLALPIDHRLAARRRPQLSQIEGEPFIMYSSEASHLHNLLTNAFRAAKIQPQFVQHFAQAPAILAMVSIGLGIAIVPEGAKNACFDNVVFRPIDLGDGIAAELYSVCKNDNRNPALPAICELLQRVDLS